MSNKNARKSSKNPSEQSVHWDYLLVTESCPKLETGTYVLVEFFGRVRMAVVTKPIAGGCYWAQLCAPVNGSTRVIVSKHSLKAVQGHA